MKPASLLAIVIFTLVALAHLLRLVFQVQVLIGGAALPMWVIALGLVVAAGLAVGLWRETGSGQAA